MKKRVISGLLCEVMVGTMLAGCGGGSGSGGSDDGKAK